jgi:hypothetical protein
MLETIVDNLYTSIDQGWAVGTMGNYRELLRIIGKLSGIMEGTIFCIPLITGDFESFGQDFPEP